MRNISRLAILPKAVLLIAAVGVAQSPATPAQSSSANSQETSPAMNSSASDTEPHTAPVFWVSTVEIFRSAHPSGA